MPQMATQHTPTKTPRGGSLSRRTVPKRDLIRRPSLNWRANSSRVGDFSFIHSPCASMSALRPLAGVVVFAVTRDHAHNLHRTISGDPVYRGPTQLYDLWAVSLHTIRNRNAV